MDKFLQLASELQQDSIVDGPGIRCVLWTQGCPHHCLGCHNPHTHDCKSGKKVAVSDILQQMKDMKLQTGITFSGGEPFLQAKALLEIAKEAKALHWNCWAYSGFTFEELLKNEDTKQFLMYLDVLVDGKFIESQKDYRLRFKGSLNQRIIDVQASLKSGSVVLSTYDEENKRIAEAT